MSQKKTNIKHPQAGDRILISPLDWGLGHTTRIIPLIRNWIAQGCIVTVAIDDPHASIISEQFPGIKILKLPGYQVKFTSKNKLFIFYLVFQIPRVFNTMFSENRWIANRLTQEHFDFIISDNRPGFFHAGVHSIYITHQINIRTGFSLLDPIASWFHRKLISRFQECWVPDWEGKQSLAGDLSNPTHPPSFHIKYLGPLSRLNKKVIPKKNRFVAVLSGPEPSRSSFEKVLLSWLEKQGDTAVLVRGLPGNSTSQKITSSVVQIFDHLDGALLSDLMQSAEWVIARSGYSTIMDLVSLEQKAILIPTPGQTEQMYLAQHLKGHPLFHFIEEKELMEFIPV
jgi:hypothetical protein